MEFRLWFDTEDDPDRKRRRQAEFLVHKHVPLDSFLEFAVKDNKMKQTVAEIIHKYNCAKPIGVRSHWYF